MTIKWRIALIIGILTILTGFYVLEVHFNVENTFNRESVEEVDVLGIWIEKLVIAESEGRTLIKHLDNNNKYSYGCLQFQEETFRNQVAKFNLAPYAEKAEVMNFIYDCDFQKSLARKMLLDNYNNYDHWRTSVKKIGLPPI